MYILRYFVGVCLLWGYIGCKPIPPTEEKFHEYLNQMYGQELSLVMENELSDSLLGHYMILDTRDLSEYRISHLPDAKWIGYRDFQEKILEEVPKDKPILVYCSVGYRSERIGLKLQKMGFKDVSNLYGGIFEWNNHGRLMYNQGKRPTDSIHTYNRKWGKWAFRGIKVY